MPSIIHQPKIWKIIRGNASQNKLAETKQKNQFEKKKMVKAYLGKNLPQKSVYDEAIFMNDATFITGPQNLKMKLLSLYIIISK